MQTIAEKVAKLMAQGYTKDQIIPLFPGSRKYVTHICSGYYDTGVRPDDLAAYELMHFKR